MKNITLNGKDLIVEDQQTILDVCLAQGIEIPRFCYHKKLSIAGNCRMCLVEVKGVPKPVASCHTQITEGMVISTNSEQVAHDRERVMELLLINHPLDCPTCDQGGECDLQDLAYYYGHSQSRYKNFEKRIVKEKNLGPFIKTAMTRCIHCTRCIRFMHEIAGENELGAVYRGEDTEITSYLETGLSSPLSGNIIDICPVGALNDNLYSFRARAWEMTHTQTIDTSDAFGAHIWVDHKNNHIFRIRPHQNEDVNEMWIHDRTRFSHDGYHIQRIDRPYLRVNGTLQECSFEEALTCVKENLLSCYSPLALIGPFVDLESLEALQELWHHIGSYAYECRLDLPFTEPLERRNYIMNTPLRDIETCDAALIVDIDLRIQAPFLLSKLWKGYQRSPFPVGCIGKNQKLPFPYALYQKVDEFYKILEKAERPLVLFSSTSSVLDLPVIRENWDGQNIIQDEASRIAALDLKMIMKHPVDFDDYDLVYLVGVDDHIDFKQLKNKFVIYQGHHYDKGAEVADVILPSFSPMEKRGTYANVNGIYQIKNQVLKPLGLSRWDCDIFKILKKSLPEIQKNQKPSVKENFKKPSKRNFYQTDVISRSSVMMAKFLLSKTKA